MSPNQASPFGTAALIEAMIAITNAGQLGIASLRSFARHLDAQIAPHAVVESTMSPVEHMSDIVHTR